MGTLQYTQNLALYGEYDVVVLGGGPSGVCAAVCAARQGMKVLLAESTANLGGMATNGKVGPFMTNYDRDGNIKIVGGIFDEIIERLKKYSAVIDPTEVESPTVYTSFIEKYHRHVTPFDSFYLEIVLDEMVREAGVELLCYTQFADCVTKDGEITHAVLAAPEGLICVAAKVFIDCTGIAAVAAKAGVTVHVIDADAKSDPLGRPATVKIPLNAKWDPTDNTEGNPYLGKMPTLSGAEDVTLKKSLSELAAMLDDRFYRVGRSAIVNLTCISRVTKTDIHLNDGTTIPLPRGAYEGVNRAIINLG